jgi:HSP20 family molecular chaperone IbpA
MCAAVTAQRKPPMELQHEGFLLRERPSGKMSRNVIFPDTADLEHTEVKLEVRAVMWLQ